MTTIDDYLAITEHVAADPRYQQLRATTAQRVRTYARTLIHDPAVSDDDYHRRTTTYGLDQLKAFFRETEFLYTLARTALAATGQLHQPAATPATVPANLDTTTPAPGLATRIAGSWSDAWYEHPWYMAARSAMATRIRQHDLLLIDDLAVSDEQFQALSDEFRHQQTRQLFSDTIAALGTGPDQPDTDRVSSLQREEHDD